MQRFLEPFIDLIYAAMRVVVGFMFWSHGAGKIFGAFGGRTREWASLTGVAGLIEVVAGFLIIVGLFTTYAAFLSSGEMASAYFLSHAPNGMWPIENGGELPVVYCFVFLYVAARGGGAWSLDALLRRSSKGAASSLVASPPNEKVRITGSGPLRRGVFPGARHR